MTFILEQVVVPEVVESAPEVDHKDPWLPVNQLKQDIGENIAYPSAIESHEQGRTTTINTEGNANT